MKQQVFFGEWSDLEEMRASFVHYGCESAVPAGIEVLFASYDGGGYEGYATVVFRHDGKLYEVHGSHCSCYGLEDEWKPEEATVESLAKTVVGHLGNFSHSDESKLAWGKILARLERAARKQELKK